MAQTESGRTVIRGGQVIDGTGAEPRRADVLVEGQRIREVGQVAPQAGDAVLEAAGRPMTTGRRSLFVAPGFLNIHGHSDLSALAWPEAENRIFEGVTTEVSGQCGHTVFPLLGAMREYVREDAERDGVALDWTDFADYAARLEGLRPVINHAFMVGHGSLRAAAMGLDNRAPTPGEQETMRALLGDALDQGVFGLSSGLIYPPGCFAGEDELADLAAVCGQADPPALYASHQRSEGDALEASVAEFLAVVKRSGARGQLSHVKVTGKQNWHKLPWLREQLESARAAGLDVHGDRYPYTASATGLSRDLPKWLHAGGRAAFLERLADPAIRRRVAGEMRIDDPVDYWDRVVVAWSPRREHEPYFGRSIHHIAADLDREPLTLVCDLLLEAGGDINAIFHRMDEGNLRQVLTWPFIVIGSDSRVQPASAGPGRGLPHPRGFGTHARVLGRYVRETGVLTWAQAVHKMTGAVADILGLHDRGTLTPGAFADVVVFDPETVADRATYEEPRQLATGVVHVLVNGEAVLENGRPTGRRPGRVLRRQ